MLHNRIIAENKDIFNFIKKAKLDIHLTKLQNLYLVSFIMCLTISGSCSKILNISKMYFINRHQTSIGRFLSNSKWNTDKILSLYQKFIRNIIWGISLSTRKSIQVIIDDTVLEKTKPSSKAKKPSEKCGYHHSHTKDRRV